jgi:hypothetical protein
VNGSGFSERSSPALTERNQVWCKSAPELSGRT